MRSSKQPIYSSRVRRYLLPLLALLAALSLASPVSAATKATTQKSTSSASNISDSVTQSYDADPSIQIGMIVALKPQAPTTVIPLANNDIKNMLGVVVPAANAAIVLTPQTVTSQQVLVATVGSHEVLVSNQNGPIKIGDYVTISAVGGVGMKADAKQAEVVGKAAGSFSGTSNVVGTVKLKDQLGHASNVAIGRISVDLNVTHNPLSQKGVDYVPGFLNNIANGIASKPVSAARIYLSAALLLATAFVTANMLYSGVRAGIVAIGRNPLSKKSILRGLIQTIIAGLIIFIAGVFAVYLLLKL